MCNVQLYVLKTIFLIFSKSLERHEVESRDFLFLCVFTGIASIKKLDISTDKNLNNSQFFSYIEKKGKITMTYQRMFSQLSYILYIYTMKKFQIMKKLSASCKVGN